MLILKPEGRGNWAPLHVTVSGSRAQPLLHLKGERIRMGGITYRVCDVKVEGSSREGAKAGNSSPVQTPVLGPRKG
jgi:hypothetical protein